MSETRGLYVVDDERAQHAAALLRHWREEPGDEADTLATLEAQKNEDITPILEKSIAELVAAEQIQMRGDMQRLVTHIYELQSRLNALAGRMDALEARERRRAYLFRALAED